jgi:hypothetical protein
LFLGAAIYNWWSQRAKQAIKDNAKLDAQMPNSLLSHINLDFHAPLRGSAVADENWVPPAAGGLPAVGGQGFPWGSGW